MNDVLESPDNHILYVGGSLTPTDVNAVESVLKLTEIGIVIELRYAGNRSHPTLDAIPGDKSIYYGFKSIRDYVRTKLRKLNQD